MVTTGGTNLRDDIMRIYQKGLYARASASYNHYLTDIL